MDTVSVSSKQRAETAMEQTSAVQDIRVIPPAPKRRSMKQPILLTLILAVLATAAIAIFALITGEFGDAAGKSVLSLWAVIWFALLALCGTYKIDIVPRPRLEPLTSTFAFLGIVTSLILIWVDQSEMIGRAYVAVWVFAFATAHASLLAATREPSDGPVVRKLLTGTLALIAIAASLIAAMVLAGTSGGAIVTITMIVLVLDVTANVLVFLMRKFLAPVPVQEASQRLPEPDLSPGA